MNANIICPVGVFVLFAAGCAQALTFPPWQFDAVERAPELARIIAQYEAGKPPLKEYVGRTGHEHERAVRNYREKYRRSLGPETAKFIEQKLTEALGEAPPDKPVAALALKAAEYAPNARLFEMAEWVLDNIGLFRATPDEKLLLGQNDFFIPALRLLAMSPDPDHAAKFQSYTELETLHRLALERNMRVGGIVIMVIGQTRTSAEALAEYERILQKLDEDLQELPVDETMQSIASHMKMMIERATDRLRGLDAVIEPSEEVKAPFLYLFETVHGLNADTEPPADVERSD